MKASIFLFIFLPILCTACVPHVEKSWRVDTSWPVNAVYVSPSSKISIAMTTRNLLIYDYQEESDSFYLQENIHFQNNLLCGIFLSDEKFLLISQNRDNRDTGFEVMDMTTLSLTPNSPIQIECQTIVAAQETDYVAIGSQDKISILNFMLWNEVLTIAGNHTAFSFINDGQDLVIAREESLETWDISTGKQVHSIFYSQFINEIIQLHDQYIISTLVDPEFPFLGSYIAMIDTESLEFTCELPFKVEDFLTIPNTSYTMVLAHYYESKMIEIWDMENCTKVDEIAGRSIHRYFYTDIALGNNNCTLAAIHYIDDRGEAKYAVEFIALEAPICNKED